MFAATSTGHQIERFLNLIALADSLCKKTSYKSAKNRNSNMRQNTKSKYRVIMLALHLDFSFQLP